MSSPMFVGERQTLERSIGRDQPVRRLGFGTIQLPVWGSLVGRGREVNLIASFLDTAAVDGGALWFIGDPGVGKTVLLKAATDAAADAGTRILWAAGAEFEADLAFSALNQMLSPIHDSLERLRAVHRDALFRALGFSDGPPPDRLVVSTATMALLRRAAEAQPLLLVVDDVHWLDRASAAVLGFVARRLAGSRVGLIAASQTSPECLFGGEGLMAYELPPLDEDASALLLDARFPTLAPRVRRRVLAEAEGNPLALLELPTELNRRFGSVRVLPAVLPLGRRLQRLYGSRVAEMPSETRRMLLLAALDSTGDLRTLRAVRPGGNVEGLAPAQRAGLASVDDRTHRVAFHHPLVRSTVVELSTDTERREAHRGLAEALIDQPERHAWHLADATVESDEHVAGLLEQAGGRALHRGDAKGAVAALLRAADLSPRGADRSRRLAEAAYVGADVAGELRDASRLLVDARQADPGRGGSLQAAVTTAFLLINGEGDIDTAHRLLTGAITTQAGRYDPNDRALIEALYTLCTVCAFGGRPELWDPFHSALARLAPEGSTGLSLCARLFADPARATPAAVGELETMISRIHDEADPAVIVRIGKASVFVDRMTACREAHWRVVRDGRAGGAVTSAIQALISLCLDDYLGGEWDEAQQLADEGLALCEAHGYQLLAWPLLFGKAIIAAARGDDDTARTLADKMDRWAAPRRAGTVQSFARHARGLAALGRGDYEAAYHELSAISPPGTLPSHVPLALWTVLDLVEAAVRTNRQADAVAHGDVMRRAPVAAMSPRLALVSLGAAAIADPDSDDIALFEAALAAPGAGRWPFDLARVQLAYGERLRRARAVALARNHLSAALDTFQRLGAQPWADRARHELRATGASRLEAEDFEPGPLTTQEREIAQLAASGLTNKQIGEKLFLSHRTVGTHLYRVFPKLGITSRAALRDALTAL
jgi:DNA-binding CsgD family transcriptional regulator